MQINNTTIENYINGINNHNTQKAYKNSLNKFLTFLQTKQINEINQENINTIVHDYKAYLNTKQYKPTYLNHHLIILKQFINQYTEIEYNKNLKLQKTVREPKYLTEEQIKTALKYATDPLDKLMIRLISNTGLRIHEALKITKQDITNIDDQGNAIIKVIGKNTKQRHVMIPLELKSKLIKYSKKNQTYIFESKRNHNKPISTRTIEYRFNKLAKKIDQEENTTLYSENLKPHNLRHSFAIHALKTNEINYVKEFLGHENIATTQIYTNLKEKEVVDRFREIKVFF